jgi:hypothetical protein
VTADRVMVNAIMPREPNFHAIVPMHEALGFPLKREYLAKSGSLSAWFRVNFIHVRQRRSFMEL